MSMNILHTATATAVAAQTDQTSQLSALLAQFGSGNVTVKVMNGATLLSTVVHSPWTVNASATPRSATLAARVSRTYATPGTPTRVVFGNGTIDVFEFDAGIGSGDVSFAAAVSALRAERIAGVTVTSTPILPLAGLQPPTLTFSLADSGVAGSALTGAIVNTGSVASAAWTIAADAGLNLAPISGAAIAAGATVNLSATPPAGGTFGATLACVGASISGASQSVAVASSPTPEFIGTPLNGTVPFTNTFTNQSGGTYSAQSWNFGDGGTSTSANPTHAYTAPGTYTVTLTLTWAGGAVTRTRTAYVVASALAVPTLATLSGSASASTNAAHADTVTLNAPADQAYTVTWSRSDGATGAATSTIGVGQTAVSASSTWAAAGSGRTVDFSISPAITKAGAPTAVNVVAGASAMAISGATIGNTGQPITLTIGPVGGALAAACTVSITAAGATLSTASLSFASGATAGQNVTATWAADGVHTVSITNSLGLTNPSPHAITCLSEAYSIDIRTPLNLSKMLFFSSAFLGGSAYERFTSGECVLSGASASVAFRAIDFAASGAPLRAFDATTYTLLVDGVPHSTAEVSTGAQTGAFTVDITSITEGWHEFDISGGPAETCMKHGFYRKLSAAPVPLPDHVPVVTGTYDLHFQTGHTGLTAYQCVYARVPPVAQHTAVPFDRRLLIDRPDNGGQPTGTGIVHYKLLPLRFGDRHYPALDENGVLMSYSKQDYFQLEYFSNRPRLQLLDGPRGAASLKFATHISMSLRNGSRKIYFSDGWRVGSVSETGHVTTLAGWRHKTPAAQWDNPGVGGQQTGPNTESQLELIGDWSSVPVDRQGFWEPWGIAWDENTLGVNGAATPTGSDALHPPERPHTGTGPVLFVADTRNNRITKMQFRADVRAPAVCTEFITGLNDPWSLVWVADKLYISERLGNKISVYNALTGAFLETLVDGGAAMFTVNSRVGSLTGGNTVSMAQARDVQAPEAVFHLDGWLYYGSRVMSCIKRINLTTRVIELYLQLDKTLGAAAGHGTYFFPFPDGNSQFLNFSIGDGTFGPYGTAFLATWSNAFYGMPVAMLPSNEVWNYINPDVTNGGQLREGVTYATATVARKGVLIFAGALDGIGLVTTKQPYDQALLPSYATEPVGNKEFQAAGYHLTHGHHGYGHFGLTLPWDSSSNINLYLKSELHLRPPIWRRGKPVNTWFALPTSSVSGLPESRLSYSGAALLNDVMDCSLWYGPGGGAADNSDNSIGSIDLLGDAPSWVTRSAATSVGSRTANSSYYADSRPAARRVFYSFHHSFRHGRLLAFGVSSASGSGSFSSGAVASFDPATNLWEAASTFSDAPARVSCLDADGDVWGLADGAATCSSLTQWDRSSKTQTTRIDFGGAAGGPLAYDSRREYLFSLSYGDGAGAGADVRAYLYRELYDPLGLTVTTPTRSAVTLNSIGGALEQFITDAPVNMALDYEPDIDAFLAYDGRTAGVDRRGRVYVIKPNSTTTWDISVMVLGGASITPPATLGNGVFSRFRYVPKLKGFVLWADGAAPLHFLPTQFIPA